MRVLGIDCGQLEHRFCLLEESGKVLAEGKVLENRQQLARLRGLVEAAGPEAPLVVLEASGNCWQNLQAELTGWGWSVQAVDPQQAAQFARLAHPRHKTDKADAHSLARLGLQGSRGGFSGRVETTLAHGLAQAIGQRSRLMNQLHSLLVIANPALVVCGWQLAAPRTLAVLRRYPTTKQLRQARGLAGVRFGQRARVGEKAAQRLQEAAREALCGALNEAHAQQIGFLVEQITLWSQQIKQLLAELRKRLPQAQPLLSIPGVGELTALLVAACVPFDQLRSAKQAAAYVGLHPHLIQSGQSCYSRLSRRGDGIARSALYRAALPASQHNPALVIFYQRLLARGKTHKQALCAVAHKIIRICFALMKYQSTYCSSYRAECA